LVMSATIPRTELNGAEVDGYLEKPFERHDLLYAVRKCLRQAAQASEPEASAENFSPPDNLYSLRTSRRSASRRPDST